MQYSAVMFTVYDFKLLKHFRTADFELSIKTGVFYVLFIKLAMSSNVGDSEYKCTVVFSVQTMKLSSLIRLII